MSGRMSRVAAMQVRDRVQAARMLAFIACALVLRDRDGEHVVVARARRCPTRVRRRRKKCAWSY
jgi:hypothetical protein